ncbi:GNAT family N-acetyltransferase [Hufsiella ginkgonis]|uniref:GNAT family N-acetyltransferase n=1 Tax=Hufsiella ginkgonis TaxID=2695274 RepID=A0A7K1Y097_9SPHI|nr:GNAT family protein [Hufsiella ginkgonis]MXV16694.1 GNAT family N-acetyltransferase [Hufsiella ginkgonis]
MNQIKFRPLRMEDAWFINNLRQQEDVERMIGGVIRPVSYERDLKWVEDLIMKDHQHMIYFAITPGSSDDIIGYTSISEIDYRNGTCFWSGIKVDPGQAGRGVGTEVALKVLKYVFEELRMVRCKAECLENHQAALNMMLKVGYRQEGLMRKTVYKNGAHNNQWLLSVISSEYEEIRSKFSL